MSSHLPFPVWQSDLQAASTGHGSSRRPARSPVVIWTGANSMVPLNAAHGEFCVLKMYAGDAMGRYC